MQKNKVGSSNNNLFMKWYVQGVYVDETYDIGRVEDVHFNPW